MSRRRMIAILGAAIVLGLLAAVALVAVSVTQTAFGREKIRDIVAARIGASALGKWHVGKLSGSLITGFELDSLEIRDRDDSLFIAAGRVRVEYDIRDIIDRRILIRHLELHRPIINFTKHAPGDWNLDRLFRKSTSPLPQMPRAVSLERSFGSFIRAERVVLHDANIRLSEPWRPDTFYTAARRDTILQEYLNHEDVEVVPVGDAGNYARVRHFRSMDLVTAVRWTHPDSVGRFFNIERLAVVTNDPPLDVRDLRGTVLVVADSIWVNAHSMTLPGSQGSLAGKIVGGSGLPTRYTGRIVGDSISLADINWVYRPLPREGWGSVSVDVRNNPENLRVMEYTLTSMDLHTARSQLRGGMTFGVGDTVFRITDVDLRAAPLDFQFIQEFSERPFPVPWRGQFNGSVRARGGPVNRFVVDELAFTFLDANVPLGVSSGAGRGELDITNPSETVFRGFDVEFAHLDLRTPQFLFPEFPRHGGSASGVARLDSIWWDVRFSNADFLLHRGNTTPSHMLGEGRVTVADPFMIFDLNLNAQPLSFSAFAAAFPAFPFRGEMRGPLVVRGTMEALDIATDLFGPAGSLAFNGLVDYALPRYGVRGEGSAAGLNLRELLGKDQYPITSLNASFVADVRGDSLATLIGDLHVRGGASVVEDVQLAGTYASLRFESGLVRVDSLNVRSSVANVVASAGSFGVKAGVDGVTPFQLDIPSLQEAERTWRAVRRTEEAVPAADIAGSLSGSASMRGTLHGSLATPGVRVTFVADALELGGNSAASVHGNLEGRRVAPGWYDGSLSAVLDSAVLAGVHFRSVVLDVAQRDSSTTGFRSEANTVGGAYAVLKGSAVRGATTTIVLDSITLDIGTNVWGLAAPARIAESGGSYLVQSLGMVGRDGSQASLTGSIPAQGEMDLRLSAERVPLSDMDRIARTRTRLQGVLGFSANISGSRDEPRFALTARVDSVGMGDTRLDRINVDARYSARTLVLDGAAFHRGERAVTLNATVPLDLRADATERFPDAEMNGRVSASNVPLAIVETFLPQLRNTTGRLDADVLLGGTPDEPRLGGGIVISGGGSFLPGLGIQLRSLTSQINFAGDTMYVRRFSTAYEGGGNGDTLSVTGRILLTELTNPEVELELFTRDFRAVQLTRVADLYVNSRLRLAGRYQGAALTGSVSVDRGALYITELGQKRLVAMQNLDASLLASREFVAPVPSSLLRNLEFRNVRVTIGDQVWLRSAEASTSIQLGGEVSLASVRIPAPAGNRPVTGRGQVRPDSIYRLAIEGTLAADRGDYRMDMGVVQRKFQVEPGGTVAFFGEPELNPTLNISAVHSVRRASGQDAGRDIRIRVRLTGSLADYQVSFESVDGLELSQSDLISYLVTGRPSFELGAAGNEHLRTAFDILLPSLGTFLGDRFAGSRFDLFQLELAPLGEGDRLGEGLRDVLKRARVGVGKQIGNRTFVTATTNLCGLGGLLEGESPTTEELIQSFGVRLEHSLNRNFLLSLSAEPSTAAARCAAAGSSARGIISSPPQFGIDLFKVWRF